MLVKWFVLVMTVFVFGNDWFVLVMTVVCAVNVVCAGNDCGLCW